MFYKSKKVLAAVVIATACGSIPAATASAHEFFTEQDNVILTIEQEPETKNILTIGSFSASCNTFKIEATATKSTEEVNGTTRFKECSSNVGSLTITNTGCRIKLTGETDAEGHANVHLTCEAGKSVEMLFPGCTLRFGEQTPGSGVHYTTLGKGSERTVTTQITEKEITYTKSGLTCGFINGNGKDATLTAATLAKGYEDLGNDGTPSEPNYTEGSQIGIWVE